MGETGVVMLNFGPKGDHLVARPLNAQCGGVDPCPFIFPEAFDVQFLQREILMKQRAEGPQKKMFCFYPIFDDVAMDQRPDPNNLQNLVKGAKSTQPSFTISGGSSK